MLYDVTCVKTKGMFSITGYHLYHIILSDINQAYCHVPIIPINYIKTFSKMIYGEAYV